jgi:predicted metalloprotease with PDZ domain
MTNNQRPIKISVDLSQYKAHIFNVSIHLSAAKANQQLSMPVWTPGSYMVREFAQHIIGIKAFEAGRELAVKKINKNTFELENAGADVAINYQVYGFDSSIRAAFIDDQQAFFNGTALFLQPAGLSHEKYLLTINALNDQKWQVATAMPKVDVDKAGFGSYSASSYEELVDYPFQISAMQRLSFTSATIPHEIVLVGDVRAFDEKRLSSDLSRLCGEHIALFGKAPFKEYLFIARFEEGGYGGLEHRNSTMLLSSPIVLPKVGLVEPDANYRSFLALCSHEYFHAWNVKAIKPKSFVPYDFEGENYTNMLWIFEGITSYYDDLMVRKAGLISRESYLELLAKSLTRLKRNYGRRLQSVCDASLDAWIKFYRPNENTPNVTTSYYLKGSIIALYLDLKIRSETKGQRSLDDVMRAVFGEFGDGRGISENEWLAHLSKIGGIDSDEFKDRFLVGVEEVPVEELLKEIGVESKLEPDDTFVDDKTRSYAHVGFKFRFDDNERALITMVEMQGPAMEAGLSPNDEILALNDIRLDQTNWPDLAMLFKPSESVQVLYARKKRLYGTSLVPVPLPLNQYKLSFSSKGEEIQKMAQGDWLGE